MFKNVAGQTIGCQMTDLDNNPFTGAVTVYITGNGGTQAIGSVDAGSGAGVCTHEGNAYHSYAPAQGETNYDHIAYTFTGTGAVPVTIQVYTSVNVNSVNTGGIVAASFAANALDAVWSTTARTLTSITSLVPSIWDHLLTAITTAGSVGKLLKDNITGVLATDFQVSVLADAAADKINYEVVYSSVVERPDTSTRVYLIEFYAFAEGGGAATPSAVSVSAINQSGTNRNARLDSTTPTTVATGRYRTTYTSTYTDDPIEQIILTFSATNPVSAYQNKFGAIFVVLDSKFTAAYKTIVDTINTNAARLTSDRATYIDSLPTTATNALAAADNTVDIQNRIPTALTTTNGHMKVSVESIQNVIQSATDFKDFVDDGYDPGTNLTRANVITLEGATPSGHVAGAFPIDPPYRSYKGVVANVLSTTSFDITPPSSGQDLMFAEQMLVLTNAAGFKQARTITNYVQTTGVITFDTVFNITWAAADTVEIYAVPYKHKINHDKITTVETALTNIQGTSFATGTDSLRQISQRNIYHSDINIYRDSTTDEWTVQWFKNDSPVTSGITSPTIQIIKRSDGTNLVASTAMTQVGSTGAYKYDGTSTNRITAGDAYIIEVTANIDSGTRTWRKVIGRDDVS